MKAKVNLDQVEACEAVRAYLVLRGALPAHGKVLSVGSPESGNRSYSSSPPDSIEVQVEIGEAPGAPVGGA